MPGILGDYRGMDRAHFGQLEHSFRPDLNRHLGLT